MLSCVVGRVVVGLGQRLGMLVLAESFDRVLVQALHDRVAGDGRSLVTVHIQLLGLRASDIQMGVRGFDAAGGWCQYS